MDWSCLRDWGGRNWESHVEVAARIPMLVTIGSSIVVAIFPERCKPLPPAEALGKVNIQPTLGFSLTHPKECSHPES